MSAVSKGPAPVRGPAIPDARVSSADFVDYHMILDQELTQLARPESGVIGALGFTALGAALGLLPTAIAYFDKAPKDITRSDSVAVLAEASTMTMGVVCLVLFGIASWRNKGLADAIRDRQRKPVVGGGAAP